MTKKKPQKVLVKPKLNLEKLTKSKTIIERITTLHGTGQFSTKTGRSLGLWSILMIGNVIWTIIFVMLIKERYNSDQIVTKIYSDHSVEEVPFPAVSICNFNVVSLRESKNIEKILTKYDVSQKDIQSFFSALPHLRDFGLGSAAVGNHSAIMEILKHHFFNMETIMDEVHQKCTSLLVYCEFNRKEKNCAEVFSKIQTFAGHCCTFNYNGVEDDNDPLSLPDENLDYYYDENPDGSKFRTRLIATSQSGRSSGLKVILNLEPNDYANWSSAITYGARIILNDPNDFPETRLAYKFITMGQSLDIKVEPKILQCDADLRRVDPITRGCWFHDEVSLIHTSRYSYETCNTECKINSYMAYCGCVPYKYPVEKTNRICELSDVPCLNYMKVNWEATRTPCEPPCYKECFDKEYAVLTDYVPFLSHDYPDQIMKNHNVSELGALNVYYMKSTCNSYRMSLLVDFISFIATYGGIFSLSFGASIITMFELAYLFLTAFCEGFWLCFSRYCTPVFKSVFQK